MNETWPDGSGGNATVVEETESATSTSMVRYLGLGFLSFLVVGVVLLAMNESLKPTEALFDTRNYDAVNVGVDDFDNIEYARNNAVVEGGGGGGGSGRDSMRTMMGGYPMTYRQQQILGYESQDAAFNNNQQQFRQYPIQQPHRPHQPMYSVLPYNAPNNFYNTPYNQYR